MNKESTEKRDKNKMKILEMKQVL